MRGETTPAGDEAPQGTVAAILDDLAAAADGESAEQIIPPLCRAFTAILASYERPTQLPREARQALEKELIRAQSPVEGVLLPSYFAERGRHAFYAALGLLNRWAETPGSAERAVACPQEPTAVLVLRIVANDLDNICALVALSKLELPAAPAIVLH